MTSHVASFYDEVKTVSSQFTGKLPLKLNAPIFDQVLIMD